MRGVSRQFKILAATALVFATLSPLSAAPLTANGVERLNYRWSLRGGLAWIARVAFPSSGSGTLETRGGQSVTSRLSINSTGASAYYASSMTPDGLRTFASEDGYSFKNQFEQHRVTFDYPNSVAHVEKRSDEGVEQKVKTLQSPAAQDVLTAIYFLRQNANTITQRRTATVYTGGKGYQFVFTPERVTTVDIGSNKYQVRPFTIAPADGKKKGVVKVWLTTDDAATPVRMEIQQNYATLRLDLNS
jgi:hypothetical protein